MNQEEKNFDPELKKFLINNKLNYTYHSHAPIFTVQEAKKIESSIPGLHTKNLFLKDTKADDYYLVCMNAHKRLDINKLQKKLTIKKLSFGTPEELFNELQIKPGHVSIFCMIYAKKCHLIIDQELLEAPKIGFHPNINSATIVITPNTLKKYLEILSTLNYSISINRL